jgi:hypothetical protein
MKGFDIAQVLTKITALSYKNKGYNFVIRYISLESIEQPGDLTTAEADIILSVGLQLGIVQHAFSPKTTVNAGIGTIYGQRAVQHCKDIGINRGTVIWLDLEEVQGDVLGYCKNWLLAVKSKDYLAGLYVGGNCGLNTSQLDVLNFDAYWKSASNVPNLIIHHYCMTQTLNNATIDDDVENVGFPTMFMMP